MMGTSSNTRSSKIKTVEASTELVQILNDIEADSFDGIRAGDESWFQIPYESLAMFVKSPVDVVPRPKKGFGMKRAVVTLFFTDKKMPMTSDVPKGQKCIQDCFISDILLELERDKKDINRKSQEGLFTYK
jgi:hypothetical protein